MICLAWALGWVDFRDIESLVMVFRRMFYIVIMTMAGTYSTGLV
jgi:hypothetical protein